jgi:ABC-type transport system involved in multi-copper enzyme maturation permease subunit
MFRILFAREVRDHLLTFRFAAALVTTFVLVVMSAWVLGDDFARRRSTYNVLAEKTAQEAREVYVPSRIVPIAHRPPSPLSIFAQGEEKRLGNSVEVRRWTVPTEATDSLTDNMLLSGQPPFDLLAIFTTVLSLFGILIGYDAINGERERGTLKLICSYPVRRPTIFAVKMLAGTTVLMVPVALSFTSSLLVLQLVQNIGFDGGQWLAIALMFLTGGFYGALFVAVGLLASALVSRSSVSLILSLFFWTVTVLLIPGAANNIAAATLPALSSAEISTFEQATREENSNKADEFRQKEAPNAGSGWGCWNIGGETPFLFDTWPQAWKDTQTYVRFVEDIWQNRADQVYQLRRRHSERKREQLALARLLNWPSPAFHVREAFTNLAGTNYEAHDHFLDSVRRFRSSFIDQMRRSGLFGERILSFFSRRRLSETLRDEDWQARQASYQNRWKSGEDIWKIVGEKNWPPLPQDMVPRFSHADNGAGLNHALMPIGVLAVMTIIIVCAGFAAFLRYDVR